MKIYSKNGRRYFIFRGRRIYIADNVTAKEAKKMYGKLYRRKARKAGRNRIKATNLRQPLTLGDYLTLQRRRRRRPANKAATAAARVSQFASWASQGIPTKPQKEDDHREFLVKNTVADLEKLKKQTARLQHGFAFYRPAQIQPLAGADQGALDAPPAQLALPAPRDEEAVDLGDEELNQMGNRFSKQDFVNLHKRNQQAEIDRRAIEEQRQLLSAEKRKFKDKAKKNADLLYERDYQGVLKDKYGVDAAKKIAQKYNKDHAKDPDFEKISYDKLGADKLRAALDKRGLLPDAPEIRKKLKETYYNDLFSEQSAAHPRSSEAPSYLAMLPKVPPTGTPIKQPVFASPSKAAQDEDSFVEPPEDNGAGIGIDFGNGRGIGKDGLYDDQLESMMQRHKDFIGVIARNEIHKLLPRMHPKSRVGFIMNLDRSDSKEGGSHWVSVLIDARPHGSHSIEYYNSFADPCPADIFHDLKFAVKKLEPDGLLKFKENSIKFQAENSSECGFFACKFLVDRFRNVPFPDCTGYSDVMQGEKDIKTFKEKFPAFRYLN